jgi:predicted dinucleotide-binding enzyme
MAVGVDYVIRTSAAPALYGAAAAGLARGRISAVALTARRRVPAAALAVSLLAAPAGSAAGILLAQPWARWLAGSGLAPAGFTAHLIVWPVLTAAAAGMVIALAGAWPAARRAGRVRPTEALRDAELDRGVMTVFRWAAGLAALAGAVPVIWVSARIHSADASALFLAVAALLITGCWMLAPVLLRPLTGLAGLPLAAALGGTGMLAACGAATAIRRTVATAVPILVTLGLAGAGLAGTYTLTSTQQAAPTHRVTASALVLPAGGGGIADPAVAAIRATPGVISAVPVTDTSLYVGNGEDLNAWDGQYADGAALTGVFRLPLQAGSLTRRTGTSTIVAPADSWRLGQTASLWLDDSAPVRLGVVGVLASQIDLAQTVLLPTALRDAHTSAPVASRVYLRLARGTPLGRLRAAAAAVGGALTAGAGYSSAAAAQQDHLLLLGLALAYSAIAIANTLAMATANRFRELGTLRLTGVTTQQVLRVIALEAFLVTGIAALLAVGLTAITVAGLRAGNAATCKGGMMTGIEKKLADLDGVRMAYAEAGHGDPIELQNWHPGIKVSCTENILMATGVQATNAEPDAGADRGEQQEAEMRIAVLGTGAVGQRIAGKLLELGHDVRLGSRSADNPQGRKWADEGGGAASAGTFANAAGYGELVFNCTAGPVSLQALQAAGQEALAGKVLIDVANPLVHDGGTTTLSVCNTDSLGEQIQREFPEVRVVKALNTMNNAVMVEPGRVPGSHNVFICGNDDAAKAAVADLLVSFGWPRADILDLGDISAARGTEMYLPLWLRLWPSVGAADYNIKVVH